VDRQIQQSVIAAYQRVRAGQFGLETAYKVDRKIIPKVLSGFDTRKGDPGTRGCLTAAF
jgi:hypothetical protein